MARPAEFDRDDAIQAAIGVFARHGFAAASTTELLEAMGIARQSLYGAFGDKHSLFLEALERYSQGSLSRMLSAMAGAGSASAALEAALLLDLACGGDIESGCLGVGSIAEFGRSDADVNAVGDRAGVEVVAAFADQVGRGVASGELKPGLDPNAVGRMLLTLKSGLKVAARGGASDAEVRQSVRLVLDGISAK
jgi:AcrR family transcriptional regulator